MKILLAKQYEEKDIFLENLIAELNNQGIAIDIVRRFKKKGVLDLLKKDNDFDVLILQEYLQQYLPIDADFLNKLLEESPDIHVIFVISNEHKKDQDYLNSIYSTKVYSVLFEDDADAKNVVNLVVNKRHPKLAKSYLGLEKTEMLEKSNQEVFVDKVKKEQIDSIIEYLYSFFDEEDLSKRYNSIAQKYSDAENVYILTKIPNELKDKLKGNIVYTKYKIILEKIEDVGANITEKPKIKEKIITKEKVIKKEVVRHVYSMPKDYKKVIAVMGFENSGATTIAVNLAYILSKNKIKTALIDTDYFKKDVYYHFDKEYVDCLSILQNQTYLNSFFSVGEAINDYLTVFSEHRDRQFRLSKEVLFQLLSSSKRNTHIVIIDICNQLNEDAINSILDYSDNILFVTTQNINTLYRNIKWLYNYKDKLNKIELVVNKYVDEVKHLDEKSIRNNFFSNITNDNYKFNIDVRRVFTVSNDRKSIINGLALKQPAVTIKDNEIIKDIEIIAEYYYKKNKPLNNSFLKNIFNLFRE